MLTKQEREEITRRVKDEIDRDYIDYTVFYRAITGKDVSIGKSLDYDNRTMFSIILDLCDTSNMVELPRDKGGVPIHIGDTVWCHEEKRTVKAIKIYETMSRIVYETPEKFISWSLPELVTHAEPISDHESIARAIEDITHCLNDAAASLKLQDIAMELRKLGGSND